MAAITITLGEEGFEKSYTIRTLPLKAARGWRQQVRAPMERLFALAEGIRLDISLDDDAPDGVRRGPSMREIMGALKDVLPQLMPVLFDMLDEVFELLVAYSPELARDRAYLEEHALDEQVVDAFLKVLKLAFPLDRLMPRSPGPEGLPTSPSTPSPSGGSISAALALNSQAPATPTSTR